MRNDLIAFKFTAFGSQLLREYSTYHTYPLGEGRGVDCEQSFTLARSFSEPRETRARMEGRRKGGLFIRLENSYPGVAAQVVILTAYKSLTTIDILMRCHLKREKNTMLF